VSEGVSTRSDSVGVWAFSVATLVFGAGLAIAAALTVEPAAVQAFHIPWPVLGLAFLMAERFDVDLEVRRETHALTFTELPLTLGLVFAGPTDLLLARLVFSSVALVVFRRPPLVKWIFNSGLFGLDVGVALFVFHGVLGSSSPVEPLGWIAAACAVIAGHLVGAFAVTSIMVLAGAPVTAKSQLIVVGVSMSAAMAGCAVALGAAGALVADSRSWVLLVTIGLALGYFFVSFVRMRERHQDLSRLHDFTTNLSSHADSVALAQRAGSGLAQLLKARRVVLLVPTGNEIARIEFVEGHAEVHRSHIVGEIEWGSALALAGHLDSASPATVGGVALNGDSLMTSLLPLPENPGIIVVEGREADNRGFDAGDVQLLETAAGYTATAFHNAQLVDKLRDEAQFRAHQALHDDITDLPNQRSLIETVDAQLSAGVRLVLLTVRTHSLREVNETLGRAVGDEMLRQVAQRLGTIADHSWCARSGTDEFTLVVPGGQDEADEIGQRIVEAFDQPVLCGDVALAVTVGVGVALAPQHGTEAEMLVRRASLAASRSALDGTTVTTWASDRDPYDPNRLTIAADLRDAIPAGELEVHFQPQLDLKSNTVTGVEALVRWQHPRLGHLRPDQFIAAAEHTGAIDALTLHVLTVSAETGARWHRMGWELDMAVNLSARNLTNPHFAGEVANILEMTGFPATCLTLELTESSVMTEAERAMTTLHELHELGVLISIDDFGTGYSSLAHLRRLPVSEIKIDKSFVLELMTNASDAAIVRSMIELGHNLGLTVVAEGVETVEVRAMLSELRSDRLQGYLLSRPLTSSAFEHWFGERQGTRAAEAQVVKLESRR
jgi:diguanylate cyclase (GGDEF)-like protein